jgi:carbamoylphosphate synthase large subunit
MPVSILLLSGASLVGQNIVQALARRNQGLRLVATNSLPSDPGLADFDSVVLVPPTRSESEKFDQIIEQLIDREKPALTIPCRDDDVLALARLAIRRPDLAPKLLCGSLETAGATIDKWASWEFSQKWDLPFVPTILPDKVEAVDRFAQEQGFPLLAKPRLGFASRGVSIIQNREQLAAITGDHSILLQRYLGSSVAIADYIETIRTAGIPLFHSFESTKYSFQALISRDGKIIDKFATEHHMSQGISQRVSRCDDADGLALGMKCASAFAEAGWRGPINIQCQRAPDGKLFIYEFNGRFTGATAARMLLGYDEVSIALQHYSGIVLSRAPKRTESFVLKQPVSRTMPHEIQYSLETVGVWPPV